MSWRGGLYRATVARAVSSVIRARRKSSRCAAAELLNELRARPLDGNLPTFIFHAASVGEMEALLPVLWGHIAENPQAQYVISGFSPSLDGALRRLASQLTEKGVSHRIGWSPAGQEWTEFLSRSPAKFFLTVKYEAWPELWMALARHGIPLVILNARSRPSLQWCQRLVKILGSALPPLLFLTDEADDLKTAVDLRNDFPSARITWGGDPRWDRVRSVQTTPSPQRDRAQKLIEQGATAGAQLCLAQVWPEDRELILRARKTLPAGGRLWIIPHRLEEAALKEWRDWFMSEGISVYSTRENLEKLSMTDVIWVDEAGVLTHLYAAMSAIYVGGGFGRGPHSTIEPAFSGVPLACGPNRAERFSEISFLNQSGQLTIVRDAGQFTKWLKGAVRPGSRANSFDLSSRLGATSRILDVLRELPAQDRLGSIKF